MNLRGQPFQHTLCYIYRLRPNTFLLSQSLKYLSVLKFRTLWPKKEVKTFRGPLSLEIEALPDLNTCLLRRKSLVSGGPKGDRVASYLLGVIRNIAGTIAFEEWSGQDHKFQKQFIRQLARSLSPDAFKAIDKREDISPKFKSELYSKLATPVRKMNKIMAQREQFLNAYVQVSNP